MENFESLTITNPHSLFTPASATHVKSAINFLLPERPQDMELREKHKKDIHTQMHFYGLSLENGNNPLKKKGA